MPSSAKKCAKMRGESECSTGSPMTAKLDRGEDTIGNLSRRGGARAHGRGFDRVADAPPPGAEAFEEVVEVGEGDLRPLAALDPRLSLGDEPRHRQAHRHAVVAVGPPPCAAKRRGAVDAQAVVERPAPRA